MCLVRLCGFQKEDIDGFFNLHELTSVVEETGGDKGSKRGK